MVNKSVNLFHVIFVSVFIFLLSINLKQDNNLQKILKTMSQIIAVGVAGYHSKLYYDKTH